MRVDGIKKSETQLRSNIAQELNFKRYLLDSLGYFETYTMVISIILLHSALYTVSFYKALWTSGYTSRAIGWGNPLAGECVTLLSNSAVTIIEES